MKIALDAKRALTNVAGLGQYSRILINAFLRDFPQHEYHLYTPKQKAFLANELIKKYSIHFPSSFLDKKIPAFWRSFGVSGEIIKGKYDLYHGLSNELPLTIHKVTSVKKVVTIHDVIFLKHKEQYSAFDRRIYDYKTRYAAKHADVIATISEETKADLINYYRVAEKKIKVVYPSCAPEFYKTVSSDQKEKIRLKYNLPENYILNVSSYFARKNHKNIVEALNLLKGETDIHVVFIGGQGNIKEEVVALIKNKGLESRFHLLSGVSNEEMPAIYQLAKAFVYPSYYEGFGIPILEALFSGIPVIASAGGCFEEVGGKDTLYINPSDVRQLADALKKVLTEEKLRATMIMNGLHHAAGMNDQAFAQGMMKVYQL